MSDKINDGGPAFPAHDLIDGSTVFNTGMTLRDYFAAHAPTYPKLSTTPLELAAHVEANWRFEYADAMVKKAREGK